MSRFRRPGRQPGSFTAGREGRILLVLVAGIGLAFLRSYLSLSLLEASQLLDREQRSLEAVRQELDWQRVEVQRLASPSRIEPAASREGFVQPEHESVILLTTRESAPPLRPGARPLRALGAGVLVYWFERAAKAATISAAAAAGHEGNDPGLGGGSGDSIQGSAPAAGANLEGQCEAGEHGARVARCEFCRALAAGRAQGH
jgi:hypothetical protein